MRYERIEENEIESEEKPAEGYQQPPRSDQTAFMRWSTELEEDQQVTDRELLKKHRPRILDINKFLPLSNIRDKKTIKLFRLRRLNMDLAWEQGLDDLAVETALDNLADYQTTRGQKGFYQKALITQRREWEEKGQEDKKQGLLKSLIRAEEDKQRYKQPMEG